MRARFTLFFNDMSLMFALQSRTYDTGANTRLRHCVLLFQDMVAQVSDSIVKTLNVSFLLMEGIFIAYINAVFCSGYGSG